MLNNKATGRLVDALKKKEYIECQDHNVCAVDKRLVVGLIATISNTLDKGSN